MACDVRLRALFHTSSWRAGWDGLAEQVPAVVGALVLFRGAALFWREWRRLWRRVPGLTSVWRGCEGCAAIELLGGEVAGVGFYGGVDGGSHGVGICWVVGVCR